MNSAELIAHLRAAGVPADAYSVGDDCDEAYCLVRQDDRWSVYYSERGRRTDEVRHASEADACAELLGRLMRDHVVRRRMTESHYGKLDRNS